jgi:hypothetical protein
VNTGEVDDPHPRPTSNIPPSFIDQAGQWSWPIDDDTTVVVPLGKFLESVEGVISTADEHYISALAAAYRLIAEEDIAAAISAATDAYKEVFVTIIKGLESWLLVNGGLFDVNLESVMKQISSADASQMLTELLLDWGRLSDYYMFDADKTRAAINTLLDPYTKEDPTVLKIGYPLLFIQPNGSPSPAGAAFLAKMAADAASTEYIIDRPVVYALATLAFFDDLFKGNVRNRTSLFISRLGALPAGVVGYDITSLAQWNSISTDITNILIQINAGTLSTEGLRLLRGGARRTRRRSRRDHKKQSLKRSRLNAVA